MTPPDGDALFLTLDQGGHASRALVFDVRGGTIARAMREVRVFHPQPDRVEHDPEEVVDSLLDVMAEVRLALGARAVQLVCAGLATQRSSIVCWDRFTGAALSPVLSWQDRRAHDWLAQFMPQTAAIHRITGLVLSPHYGASKLRWCLDHLPPVAQAARDGRLAIGPLASFLVNRLTGEHRLLCDPANAQRTLMLNLERLDWDEGLLQQFGMPRALLPEIVPTRHDYGHLAVEAGLPLAIVNGDQSAALFAYGRPQPGNVYINLGTGAFVQRVERQWSGDWAPLLAGVVLHDQDETVYVTEGTVNGAGSALAWAAGELGIADLEARLGEWLAREDADLPLFLNGVSGLGAPFWVADFPSRFVGSGEPWQQAVAVAESILFLVLANLEAMQKSGTPPEKIVVSGGLTRHNALCQRLSDLSGVPCYRPIEHEATARGLAWLLAGKPREWPETATGEWFRPRQNPQLVRRYRRWRRELNVALAGLSAPVSCSQRKPGQA